MLLITIEMRPMTSNGLPQINRRHRPTLPTPQLTNQLRIPLRYQAAIADRVTPIEVVAVGAQMEVVGQRPTIADTLQGGVHEAGVAQIIQATTSFNEATALPTDAARPADTRLTGGMRERGQFFRPS